MQSQSLDISEIVLRPLQNPPLFHLKRMLLQRDLKNRGKKLHLNAMKRNLSLLQQIFDIHKKVNLQNAEVAKEHQEAFKEICNEYKDISFHRF